MKYWMLTTEFPPYHGGGISTYCEETARLLTNEGMQVTVFVPAWDLQSPTQIDDETGVRVVRFNPSTLASDSGLHGTGLLAYGFREAVKGEMASAGPPALIEAQDYLGIAYFLLQEKRALADWIASTPICITLHSPEFAVRPFNEDTSYRFPKFWTDELERFCINAADMVWTPSRRVLQALGPELADIKSRLVRNPFRPLDAKPDKLNVRRGLYYFGRLQPLKGFAEAMDAYAALVSEGFEEPLNLVGGDGQYPMSGKSVLEHAKKRHQKLFDNGMIRVHGLLKREEAFSLLEEARLVLVPSRYENFPYAVLEAMSLGRAVLCSRQGGHAEIVTHLQNGFVFDHDTPGDLKSKLRQAWASSDAELSEIGRNARATVQETCHPEVIGPQKLGAIKDVIAEHTPPRQQSRFPFLRIGKTGPRPDHQTLQEIPHINGMLSVVVPYFNMGAYIDDALKSLLACDYHTMEILVCNAESTDAASIAKFYLLQEAFAKDPRFIFLNIEDRGLAHSRNEGALRARGEFLTFLDPDDMVRPTYYSRAAQVLETYRNVGFVGCWVQYFEGANGRFIGWNPEPPYVLFHNTMNTASMVVRRRVFMAHGMNDLGMIVGMEDYEAMVRMVGAGFGGVVIPEILFDYRVRANSMMRGFNRLNDIYSYERIAERNPSIFREHAVDIVGLLNANGPGFKHDNPLIEAPL